MKYNSQSLNEVKNFLYKAAGFIPIGIGLSVFFWLFESWIHVSRTGHQQLLREILSPSIHEIWMRSLVCFIVICFFTYAQIIIKRLSRNKARLQKLSDELEHRIRERTAEVETAYRKLKGEMQERIAAEEQLAIFKKFAESSTQGFSMADLEGNIIYCNDALCYDFLGEEEPKKAIGKNISCYYDEKLAKILQQQILPLVLDTGQWTGETSLVSVDGKVTESILSVFLIRNNKGEPAYFAKVATDITERKLVENSLRRHDEFLGSLLESMTHPFLVFDINNYTVEMANSAAWKEGNSKGMACYEVSHGRDHPCDETEHPCPLEQVKKTGQPVTMEHIHHDESGNARNVEVHCYPLFDDQGHVIKIIEYCLDITERRQLEEQAKVHQAELAHVSRLSAVGEMASGLAHELNQPLCAIQSRADLCLRALDGENQNNDKIKENLRIIEGQAERAGNVIRRIKAFVKKREPNRSSVDICNVVRETLAFADSEIRNNNVKVCLDLSEQIPMVLADRVQIEQVLLNLIRNAVEAMDETEQEKRNLSIQISQDSHDKIYVAVRDNGKGLTSEVEEHLFEAFFTTKPNDMGIGLSISRSIINVHHGDLWGECNPDGDGSTFTFTLPVSETMVCS